VEPDRQFAPSLCQGTQYRAGERNCMPASSERTGEAGQGGNPGRQGLQVSQPFHFSQVARITHPLPF